MSIFHVFAGLFNPVDIEQVRFSYNNDSQIEIEVDPDKICNKLVCGDYDYWWPVLTENGSPTLDHLMAKYRVGKKLSIYENGRYAPPKEHIMCNYSGYTQHIQVSLTTCRNLYVVNCKRYYCHPSPLTENPLHIWKITPTQENAVNSYTNCTDVS